MSRRFGAAGALALLLCACSSEPPEPAQPASAPDAAFLIVYRPHADANASNYPFVYVDDQKKGALPDGGVLRVDMAPGPHRITLSNPALWEEKQYWQVNAVPGRRYYYRLRAGQFPDEDSQSARYLSKTVRVDQLAEETAAVEIRALQKPQ
jgi:hypothetical protein